MVELSERPTDLKPKKPSTVKTTEQVYSIDKVSSPCISLDKDRIGDILENFPSAMVVFEKPDGKVVYANKRSIELHGVNPCGIPIEKFASELKIFSMDGKMCPTEELYVYRALFNEEIFHNEPMIIERVDGERFIVSVSAKPLYDKDGKVNGAMAIYDDVTEGMQTQEALMDSEERLNMAQRIAHLGSWEYFVEVDKAVWSEELFRIFGLPQQQFGPNLKDYLTYIHPDDRAMMEKSMRRGRVETANSFDYRILRKDRSLRIIHTERIVREYAEDGRPARIMGVEQDITERMKTQQALMESESRLKMAQQIAHVGSWEYYVKEDKAVWSDELFRIFGLPIKQYGPTTSEYAARIHPDDRETINKTMEQMLFSGGLLSKASFDYRIVCPDGVVRTIHSERMIREVDEDKKPLRIAGIEQDITERKVIEKKLEEYAKNLEELVEERTRQLKDVERLAAIGQTAGMIGHDIRNPLQAITGELYLMKQDVDTSPESECKRDVQESLTSIQEQVDYISKIIADLQDYARPLKPEMAEVDLCTAIPQMVATVKVPPNVEAHSECEPQLPKIKVDKTLLKRVLVNLAINAIQAMPNGGKLTIKALREQDGVCIIVADTGVGISDEFKEKIFQPLMTTKAKGQGLGLAVVKRLVEAQGGTIGFESQVGVGTQFKITFPKTK